MRWDCVLNTADAVDEELQEMRAIFAAVRQPPRPPDLRDGYELLLVAHPHEAEAALIRKRGDERLEKLFGNFDDLARRADTLLAKYETDTEGEDSPFD